MLTLIHNIKAQSVAHRYDTQYIVSFRRTSMLHGLDWMGLTVPSGASSLTLISNKLYAWRHNMPLPPANWQYLCIYSPGGGAVPA